MSRCFPFPPPGYEKKSIIDDGDLITKEKHKERKHKKDKKDKERKEGKDKKDKEKSKEKHKEKKERKEKHKDKDKKDKSRSKDKKEKDRNKDRKEGSTEKRVHEPHVLHNGGNLAEPSQQRDEFKGFKFVHELARRIGDENGATGSHTVQKTSFTNHEREKIPGRDETYINHISAENEKHGKNNNGRRIDGQQAHSNVHKTSVDNHLYPGDQRRSEVSAVPVGKKNVEHRIMGKWKNGLEDDNKSIKPMGRDQDKREKNKQRDKEKEKKEKVKQTCTVKPFDMSKDLDDNKSSLGDGNLGKRKEIGNNGFIHADKSNRPHKLARHASSTHLLSENGKKMEAPQNSLQLLAEKPLPYSNGKVTIKEKRLNGYVEPSSAPMSTNVQVNENGEAYRKLPHPDTKYLNQILAVPRMEELPEIDHGDQDWLFRDSNTQAKNSDTYMPGDGSKQVWAEIVHFEEADLIALPYVIPY